MGEEFTICRADESHITKTFSLIDQCALDAFGKINLLNIFVEDNDDIVPLFNSQTDTLRKTYGNYYIAELVEAQSEELKCIVVECERRAVGFVSGTRRVDFNSLNEQYDLSILHGLKKPHKDDILNQDDAPKQENPHDHIKGGQC
ncbi:hypothetical protein X801_02241 [Opisthorchis viverrini]|uniref:Cilia- and flagella-associated protein 61 N-terminal domain-containing protein n=1 Tax=Opisthorchis viverrini TaxID=6198 RepID=A0A1S8X564_OPIVI|nr:hypothetical protein X801_02241 [Opisthorchis viverrini]